MVLKRKRSFSDNTSPASSTSSFLSSRASQSPTPTPRACFPHSMHIHNPVHSHPAISSWNTPSSRRLSSDLNSRTRKRFRDNRPDEHTVHETTLTKLFAAQRTNPHASPIPSSAPPPHSTQQKSTLHTFWRLPTTTSTPSRATHAPAFEEPARPRCQDCDRPLELDGVDGMDVDMDGGLLGAGDRCACYDCGRRVCGLCAVAGDVRMCLGCATVGR